MIYSVIQAFTTLVRPLERAIPAMISSAAFPEKSGVEQSSQSFTEAGGQCFGGTSD